MKYDWQITERRNTIMLLLTLAWFVLLGVFWAWVFQLRETELQTYTEYLAGVIPDSLGIMIMLWPFYAMFVGIGVTYAIVRLIFRLCYGTWV
jgi:hypothetical protein